MDKTDIFARTTKGEQEITTQANKLPIKHRSVLIMIDGKASEEVMLARLSGMRDALAILNDLEAQGFIERKAAPRPVFHALEDKGPSLNMAAKQYMIDYLYATLGPESDAIVARIEKCRSNAELAEMAAACSDTMAGVGKRKKAEDFELKMKGLLV